MHDDAEADAASVEGAEVNPGDSVPVSEQLVRLARTTGARISFTEDPALLADVGGVGALLRYRL